ncbi:hypothetical protein N865_16845 [Intrasporangium oryzae NRRL B-24470]|uniref:SHOCT domain-containing protein n=2 Tax=Intrasporangium TaxID=53357 RepID=W9GB17_9MICO|nr:hypothetical protein N865_16845 [Intrasporangium oryzae NRRL B-24470]
MWNYGMGWGMGPAMWVILALGTIGFWALVIWVVRELVRARPVTRESSSPEPRDDPLRLLDERLARGEIDTEEYERIRRVLTAKR